MRRAWVALALLACWPASAQAPMGQPRTTAAVRDADFGVATRQFGLDRRVEVLQWQRSGDGYRRVWHDAPIDDATHAPGHENPDAAPLPSRRWWSDSARLEGRPLDAAVLRTLGTWRAFRPDFSALPANLAVTFQPEGDGLGSAVNPLEPQVGDMRVTWRELLLPPLDGRVELRAERWVLRDAQRARVDPPPATVARLPVPRVAVPTVTPPAPSAPRLWPWVAGVLGVLLVVTLARALRVRRAVRGRVRNSQA